MDANNTCQQCGQEFERTSLQGRPPSFCPACRDQRRNTDPTGAVRCGRCKQTKPATEFNPSQRRNGAWCKACLRAAYLEGRGGIVSRPCEHCGVSFKTTATSKRRRFCSSECKTAAAAVRRTQAVLAKRDGRVCAQCGVAIPVERRSDAVFCSEACSVRARHAADPERTRKWRLEARAKAFGITVEEYVRLKAGPCDICSTHESQDGRALHIDHCHTTGMVRGILCANCNKMLGLVGDDPERLRAAADYLERSHSHGTWNA